MHQNVKDNIEQGADPSTAGVLHIEADHASNVTSGHSRSTAGWRRVLRWFRANTFSPSFLTSPWSHPSFGYIFAILGQIVVVALTILIIRAFPNFPFPTSLVLLVVLLAALGWGVGPSVVATLAGVILLVFLLFPPYFSLALPHVEDYAGIALFTCVGLFISILASQVQRAYYRAQTLSARLETIIEAIPDSVVIFDPQGNVIQWNPAARMRVTTKTPDITLPDLPEQLDLRDLQGEKLNLEELPLARALRGEIVRNGEMAYKTAVERQDRFVSVSAAPLRDPRSGIIEGAVTIARDLSPLRQAQYQAAEQSSQLEAIFESITDQLLVYDRQGQLVRVNEASRRFDELIIHPEQRIIPAQKRISGYLVRDEKDRPLMADQIPIFRILQGTVLTSANAEDVRLSLSNGRDVQLSVTGAPIYDALGELVGGVLVCRDVTERRSLEQRTRAALDALLEIAQVLVQEPSQADETENQIASTESMVVRRLAELTRQVLGCQRLGFTGVEPNTERMYPLAVVGLSPELEQQWWDEQRQVESHLGDGLDPAMTAQLRAGEALLMDLTLPPWQDLPNPYGIRILLVAPMRVGDQIAGIITLDYGGADHEYTQDEIRLTLAVGRLAALVIERHRLLREREEARASAMALQVANERMDTFIGIAGHELKTPLTSIKGNLQLVIRRLSNILNEGSGEEVVARSKLEPLPAMLDRAERHVNILTRLVTDLVEVSRVQAGKLELQLALCDLTNIVREAVADYRDSVPNRVIQLELQEDAAVPIMADADRVGQVLINYLSNALKYSEADRPVQVRLEVSGSQARVSVRDEGPGLSSEEQQRVWERFYRVPGVEVQSGSGVGLGLGLHICRTIIEEQGGSVGVESIPGQGSTFWFTLPLSPHDSEKS